MGRFEYEAKNENQYFPMYEYESRDGDKVSVFKTKKCSLVCILIHLNNKFSSVKFAYVYTKIENLILLDLSVLRTICSK